MPFAVAIRTADSHHVAAGPLSGILCATGPSLQVPDMAPTPGAVQVSSAKYWGNIARQVGHS